MRRKGFGVSVLTGAMALAGAAAAQPEPGYAVVPVADRLTIVKVFGDASMEVQLAFAILLVSTLAALAVLGD